MRFYFCGASMKNILLKLTYDGTHYAGWQCQKNACAISDVVSEAIFKVTGERVKLIGCSRTDAGVHAAAYAANFLSGTKIPFTQLPMALNFYLPKDIAVFEAFEVSKAFHAQYSAVKKEYRYTIENSTFRNPLNNNAQLETRPLDVDAMKQAAALLVGTHDFKAFSNAGGSALTSVRTLFSCSVKRVGTTVQITVCGNGFLYNMVRIIAGTLLEVGRGRLLPEAIPDILLSLDRTRAGKTLCARGLVLRRVWYGAAGRKKM